MRTNVGWFAAVAVLTSALWSAPPARSENAPIVIGLAVAQTGFMVAADGDAANSVRLWIEERNAKGGLLGRQLKEITVDTKTDRAESARAGQAVINQGADLVFVSCDYDEGSPAAAVAQRANKISVFLCAGDPKAGIQGVGRYAFSAGIASQVEGATIAEWAQKNLGIKKVYSLVDNGLEYSKSTCAGWDWAVKNKGLESLGSDTFRNDDPSIQSQITRINNLPVKPDAIMLCTFPPGGASVIRQIRAAGLTMPLLCGAAMDGIFWINAVPDLSDFYIAVYASIWGDDPSAELNTFPGKFAAKFGHPPANAFAIPPYAFLNVWAKAVEKAGTIDAAKVVPIVEQYRDEPTLMGPLSFSDKLHIQDHSALQILKYEKGKPKDVGTYRISEPVPFQVLFRTK
jgi:branched-chain amino acid transport system substrate-binding protein